MFDIGFPELLIVSIVALLVIGPEKLPETVRSVAIWVGRLKRSLANIRTEIENEIGADEIRRELHNESIMRELNQAKQSIDDLVNDTNASISEIRNSARVDPGVLNSKAKLNDSENPDTDSPPPERTTSPTESTDTPSSGNQQQNPDDRPKQSESGG